MKMRPPAIPLITVDPYFSVWSCSDKLYDSDTVHWTGSPNTIKGTVIVGGEEFSFMGKSGVPVLEQISFDMTALTTHYSFYNDKIALNIDFFSSLFPDDVYRLSRPVSYMKASYSSVDGNQHDVKLVISVSEELCLDKKGDDDVDTSVFVKDGLVTGSIGSRKQKILNRSGDDLRIDWGRFYISVAQKGSVEVSDIDSMKCLKVVLPVDEKEEAFVLFSYDDIKALNYFGTEVPAFWKTKGISIEDAITEAYNEADEIYSRCVKLSLDMFSRAECAGGEKYAELLTLAFKQVIAAHKTAVDENGDIIFISKECFSNGCAATVDVTYPSSPFFLLYNTELLKGMLRPVFRFSVSDEWKFDFAPHDVGQYPLILGQVYGKNHEAEGKYLDYQMPVEECGNMLIMMANIALVDKNTDFADMHDDILKDWVKYLIRYGMDPENQLCTDDFAGHLAHNCNLSLKAIMGIAGYSIILRMKGDTAEADKYFDIAKEMADNWVKTAANSDGSFRLTFDKCDTFSMKYNMIWDKIWHTGLFAPSVYYSEFSSNKKHVNAYGMPLDNRKTYTKSDWLLWTACLAPSKKEFEEFISPMWNCFNVTPSRVPMTDWYDTITSLVVGFRHRSVQGGLFVKLLETMVY
ncbi:MAG: DUF4965 domain-containing protein [Ruminococcaceae bacterium]|nr:DUF4965 domain-containing protein [Oscillospiraceae bacterium]